MSFGELLFLSLVALLVFGPKKLPEIARVLGKTMAELRRASNEFRHSLEEEIRNLEYQEQLKAEQAARATLPAAAEPEAPVAALPENTEPYSSPDTAHIDLNGDAGAGVDQIQAGAEQPETASGIALSAPESWESRQQKC
jgi:sec-independent protein translocase protein TatB